MIKCNLCGDEICETEEDIQSVKGVLVDNEGNTFKNTFVCYDCAYYIALEMIK